MTEPSETKEDYFSVEALSKSGLVKLAKSPAHFKAPAKPLTTQQQNMMAIGTAFHCLTLEPQNFEARFAILEEGVSLTTKAGKEAKKEAREANKILLKHDDYENIKGMARAVHNHPGAHSLVNAPGPVETPIYWKDPLLGIKCKAKPDKVTANCMIIDLKSTGDARPEEFTRTAYNLHYHWSAWWYCFGMTITTGVPHRDYVFIVAERAEPWGVKIYFADIDMMLLAAQEIAPLKKQYAECLAKNEWPSYSTEPDYLHLPPWAKKADLITGLEEARFLITERSED